MILGSELPLMTKEKHKMTAKASIDPARLLEEQLDHASPDLLSQMLSMFIAALMFAEADALCGAPYGNARRDG